MASSAHLGPTEVADAFAVAAGVLADHSHALDRLEMGSDWDEMAAEGDGSSEPPPGSPLAGADLAATLAGVADAIRGSTTFALVADGLEAGSSTMAAGSAGAGLAEVLAGLAESLRNADRLDGARLALGLEIGAERLAGDDDGRHAGCLPAVVAVAADAALAAVDAGAELPDVLLAAADDGLVELETGPVANPDLVERGVVDAAAAGFLLMLDVLASVVTGEPLPAPPTEPARRAGGGERFEIRCRVEPHEGCGLDSANWLETTWHELGQLVQFDPSGVAWRIELLTVFPGAAVEAIHEVGRPRELHIAVAPEH